MTIYDWESCLETGNQEIDEQHKGIFALAKRLQVACDADHCDYEDVGDTVFELSEYVVGHFSAEEELMAARAYPELSTHRSLHQGLTGETLKITARYFNDDDVLPEELAPFLAKWLRSHILNEDIRFAEFCRRA